MFAVESLRRQYRRVSYKDAESLSSPVMFAYLR